VIDLPGVTREVVRPGLWTDANSSSCQDKKTPLEESRTTSAWPDDGVSRL